MMVKNQIAAVKTTHVIAARIRIVTVKYVTNVPSVKTAETVNAA
jgi:hypothetical protein